MPFGQAQRCFSGRDVFFSRERDLKARLPWSGRMPGSRSGTEPELRYRIADQVIRRQPTRRTAGRNRTSRTMSPLEMSISGKLRMCTGLLRHGIFCGLGSGEPQTAVRDHGDGILCRACQVQCRTGGKTAFRRSVKNDLRKKAQDKII